MTAGKKLIWTWLLFALCGGANAITADSPSSAKSYEGIAERNIFGLKPPPPPAVVDPKANLPPPPKILLTGITTFGGKKALMKATPPAKPGEPPKEQYYMLREGERDGDIMVVQIDERAGIVKVENYGTEQTLSFDKDGVKPAGAAPAPGAKPPTGLPAPAPPPVNPFTPSTGAGGFRPANPARPPRIPGVTENAGANPAVSPSFGTSSGSAPNVSFGNANYNAQAQAQGQQQQTSLPYDQQLVLIELERERTKDRVLKGELPPLPYTELTPPDAVGGRQNPVKTPQLPQ